MSTRLGYSVLAWINNIHSTYIFAFLYSCLRVFLLHTVPLNRNIFQTDLFDPQVRPIQVRVNLGVMVMKEYSTLLKSPGLKPHHLLQLSVITKIPLFGVCGSYPSTGGIVSVFYARSHILCDIYWLIGSCFTMGLRDRKRFFWSSPYTQAYKSQSGLKEKETCDFRGDVFSA